MVGGPRFHYRPDPLNSESQPARIIRFRVANSRFSRRASHRLRRLPHFIHNFSSNIRQPVLTCGFVLV